MDEVNKAIDNLESKVQEMLDRSRVDVPTRNLYNIRVGNGSSLQRFLVMIKEMRSEINTGAVAQRQST